MEKKGCKFCQRSKQKGIKWTIIGVYIFSIFLYGQIMFGKLVWDYIKTLF
jgi:hypothetical protein